MAPAAAPAGARVPLTVPILYLWWWWWVVAVWHSLITEIQEIDSFYF
jgi:hypothetical protein